MNPENEPRPTCYRCFRPRLRCVCDLVPRVRNRTPVIILQHPRERFHPFGTATLAKLGLERLQVHVAWRHPQRKAWLRFEPGDRLLFPDPTAPELRELATLPRRLVVVDGTWAHARRVLLDSGLLDTVPRVRLDPDAPSRYRIRREPSAECLSTLESVVAALRVLEPETKGFDALLAAFDAMVERQLELSGAARQGLRGGRRRVRVRPARALPEPLRSHPESCVVVYGESAAPPPGERRAPRRPVYFVAVPLMTGECFECFIGDGQRPSDWHLAHMQLDASRIEAGVTLERARQDWLRFLGPRVVVAWNRSSLDLARALGAERGLLLKSVYCNVTRRSGSSLDEIMVDAGLAAPPLPFSGRAQERAGQCLAIARWLNGGA